MSKHLLRTVTRRRVLLIEESTEYCANKPRSRAPVCPHHEPAVPMRALGESHSAAGDRVVLYACEDPACGYHEAFGTDPRTGKPRRLLRGFDQSDR